MTFVFETRGPAQQSPLLLEDPAVLGSFSIRAVFALNTQPKSRKHFSQLLSECLSWFLSLDVRINIHPRRARSPPYRSGTWTKPVVCLWAPLLAVCILANGHRLAAPPHPLLPCRCQTVPCLPGPAPPMSTLSTSHSSKCHRVLTVSKCPSPALETGSSSSLLHIPGDVRWGPTCTRPRVSAPGPLTPMLLPVSGNCTPALLFLDQSPGCAVHPRSPEAEPGASPWPPPSFQLVPTASRCSHSPFSALEPKLILLKCRWRRSGAQSSSAPPSLQGPHSAPLSWSLPSRSLTCSNPLDTLPAQHLCGCPPCPRWPQGLSPWSPPSRLCSVGGSSGSLLFKTAIFLTPNLTPIGVIVLPSTCCPIKHRL